MKGQNLNTRSLSVSTPNDDRGVRVIAPFDDVTLHEHIGYHTRLLGL